MALYTVTQGGVQNALDVNQFYNLLTGSMTDQQITVANRIRAASTGATTNTGYVGGVAGAPPASGTFAVGDFSFDTTLGNFWWCTSAGTPGSWQSVGMGVISEQILSTTTASVTFSSIPGTFKHLLLLCQGRTNGAVLSSDGPFTINGDTGAHYSYMNWFMTGQPPSGSPGQNNNNGQTNSVVGPVFAGASTNSTTAGCSYMFIPNYSSASWQKMALIMAGVLDGGNFETVGLRWVGWSQAAAVTSITITPSSGSLVANSMFTLFGMP